MISSKQIQAKLVLAIEESGMELAQIAKEIGVDSKTILRIIDGEVLPALDTFGRLCKLLNLDANAMLCLR